MAVGATLLTSLPPEILLLIAEHMDAFDLAQFSRTCRTLCHFGCCKSVAKAFMRKHCVETAISILRDRARRMDLVVELFRRAENDKRAYGLVASIAARLNDLKQLDAWRVEFGLVPTEALIGAARYDRIEVFELVVPHVTLNDITIDNVFEKIGEHDSRSLLEHLRKNYPDWVTPRRLGYVVECSACYGSLDFAVQVFDDMPSTFGRMLVNTAFYIAREAAEIGNLDVFSKFIDMFEYSSGRRIEIADTAAARNQVEIMRRQETAGNSAHSFEQAIMEAVDSNAIQAVQYLLEIDRFDDFRVTGDEMHSALISAMKQNHTDIVSLLAACVPRHSLLHAAALSRSYEEAVAFFKHHHQTTETRRAFADPQKIKLAYTAIVPDWKIAVWLVIIGLDVDLRMDLSYNYDAARNRYMSVLPAAIDLAREVGLDDAIIDQMTRFANGSL